MNEFICQFPNNCNCCPPNKAAYMALIEVLRDCQVVLPAAEIATRDQPQLCASLRRAMESVDDILAGGSSSAKAKLVCDHGRDVLLKCPQCSTSDASVKP